MMKHKGKNVRIVVQSCQCKQLNFTASVEVGTCLFKFLTEKIPRSVRRVHIYQDNTSSQSKNRFVVSSLIHSLWKSKGYLEEIEMRFLGLIFIFK